MKNPPGVKSQLRKYHIDRKFISFQSLGSYKTLTKKVNSLTGKRNIVLPYNAIIQISRTLLIKILLRDGFLFTSFAIIYTVDIW